MSLEREMRVFSEESSASPLTAATVDDAPTLRLAIATSDLRNVDEHFGTTPRLAMFEVTANTSRLAGVCEFTEAARDGDEDKLDAKLDRLTDQHAVLSTAIGGSAVRRLIARHIQPIKLGEASPIEEVLRYFQREIEIGTTPWIMWCSVHPRNTRKIALRHGWKNRGKSKGTRVNERNHSRGIVMSELTVAAIETPFAKELVRQMRALDTYDTFEGTSDAETLDPFIMTKQATRDPFDRRS